MCAPGVIGKPDLVFRQRKVAVFVDGDFWHGRQWKNRGFPSLQAQMRGIHNRRYWVDKIERNVARDQRVNRTLRRLGWSVIRVWESDLRKTPDRCILRIVRALERAYEGAKGS